MLRARWSRTRRAQRGTGLALAACALALTGCGGDNAVTPEGESAATTPDVQEYDDDQGVLLRGGYLAEPPDQDRVWPEGSDVALHGRLLNEAGSSDAIIAASSPVADRVDLVDASGQVVQELALPPGEPVDLRTGGPTVLLRGIDQPLSEGAPVQLLLTTRRSGELPTSVQVLIEDAPPTGGSSS